MKKILILGGTMFVGRTLTQQLVATRKYDVTLFNRGKSNTGLFANVKQIHGDRETADIEKIFTQHWDCIIDFSGYYPVTFEKLLKSIEGKVGRYIFISTVSVFDVMKYNGQLITEQFPTHACTEAQKTSPLPNAYGEKKAEMERILLQYDGLDKIIFRPSFIYGKYDWTQRFYYWLYRVQRCQKFLLPSAGQLHTFSLTNADDLTQALLMAVDIPSHATIYNTISTPTISVRQLLQFAAQAYACNPQIITVDDKRLQELKLQPAQFPLIMPFNFNADDTLWKTDFPFTRTNIADTLTDIRNHNAAAGWPPPTPAGALDFLKEQQLIETM